MNEIDEFLQFLLENESDERISFSKKMKYGYRYYYVNFNIDEKPEDNNKNQSYGFRGYRISDSVEIVIDNRNQCVEILYDNGTENIILEDNHLLNKWSEILEEYINKDISKKTKDVIENSLSSCYNKNLYRTYQMKKILPDNESL
jgi:uncharacterized membrane protein YfhO